MLPQAHSRLKAGCGLTLDDLHVFRHRGTINSLILRLLTFVLQTTYGEFARESLETLVDSTFGRAILRRLSRWRANELVSPTVPTGDGIGSLNLCHGEQPNSFGVRVDVDFYDIGRFTCLSLSKTDGLNHSSPDFVRYT